MSSLSDFVAAFLGFAPWLVIFVLMPWAAIECLVKESPHGNTKLTWLVAILSLPFFGAIAYLGVRRPHRKDELGR